MLERIPGSGGLPKSLTFLELRLADFGLCTSARGREREREMGKKRPKPAPERGCQVRKQK